MSFYHNTARVKYYSCHKDLRKRDKLEGEKSPTYTHCQVNLFIVDDKKVDNQKINFIKDVAGEVKKVQP